MFPGESRQWGGWERRDEGRRSSWAALEPGARLQDTPRQRYLLTNTYVTHFYTLLNCTSTHYGYIDI